MRITYEEELASQFPDSAQRITASLAPAKLALRLHRLTVTFTDHARASKAQPDGASFSARLTHMWRSLFFILVSTNLFAVNASEPFQVWDSPSSTIRAEAVIQDNESERTIYLFDPRNPGERVVLCTFNRGAELLFSPDESWIALNDEIGSNVSEIRLFKRETGLHYSESQIHADAASWELLSRSRKMTAPMELMHTYARVIQWGADSAAMLVSLSGQTDATHHIDNWVCVFDLRSRKASLNLNRLNRNAVTYPVKRTALTRKHG